MLRNNLLESFRRSNYALIIIQLAANFNRYILIALKCSISRSSMIKSDLDKRILQWSKRSKAAKWNLNVEDNTFASARSKLILSSQARLWR